MMFLPGIEMRPALSFRPRRANRRPGFIRPGQPSAGYFARLNSQEMVMPSGGLSPATTSWSVACGRA
jgi:hypothetical protein